MTLIINEIHIRKTCKESFIVACADRRITVNSSQEKKYKTQKKLFKIEYLNACLSYWGNTTVRNNKGNYESLSNWLPNFIKMQSQIQNLCDFAHILRSTLNKKMHSDHLKQSASGFHLSGFDKDNIPEFYHFSNTGWKPNENKYEGKFFKYGEVAADFSRDYVDFFTGDSISWKNLKRIGCRTYRNGDFGVQNSSWLKLDEALNEIFKQNNFAFVPDKNDINLIKYYQFKLRFIGSIYQVWGKIKNVGSPFDVVILRPT